MSDFRRGIAVAIIAAFWIAMAVFCLGLAARRVELLAIGGAGVVFSCLMLKVLVEE